MINNNHIEDNTCLSCSSYSPDNSGWCDECLDEVDIDALEERKRRRIAENNEY
jgi:hypothetical protein